MEATLSAPIDDMTEIANGLNDLRKRRLFARRGLLSIHHISNNGENPMNACLELSTDEVSADMEQEWLRNAAHEGHVPAMYDYGLCCNDPKLKLHWLRMAAEEGHVQAMYLLGQECRDLSERRRWLQIAAEEGHVPAMYEFSLLCSNLHERRRWLAEAARNGLQAAVLELAEMD